jgi:hypothetical protein
MPVTVITAAEPAAETLFRRSMFYRHDNIISVTMSEKIDAKDMSKAIITKNAIISTIKRSEDPDLWREGVKEE